MDVGLVGCGAVASRYAAGFGTDGGPEPDGDFGRAHDLRLVAAADRDVDRAAAFAAEYGCSGYDDAAAMLDDAGPELVLNLTSHGAHAAVTRTCLDAGASVYSEKPLALDAEEARALVRLAESEGLGLGCAPTNHRGEGQRLAAGRVADGSLGAVGVATATAHVGRVTEWHERPDSFLAVGPLYDGAVYPLTLLAEWFGPVTRVRSADTLTRYPGRAEVDPAAPDRPTHVEATLDLAGGPFVRLTASLYVPHRGREFYGLELHGDDGSCYLADAGGLGGERDTGVAFGRAGRGYTPVPLQRPPRTTPPLAGLASLADSIRAGRPSTASARRGAHVVAVCNAIERAAESGGPVAVGDCGFVPEGVPAPTRWSESVGESTTGARADRTDYTDPADPADRAALRLPPVGFGCSRYRDGEYVERAESVEVALDAGYRLLDSAELYGNERRIGDVLDAPGSPAREALFLLGKVWNTNHEHVREACEASLRRLGVDAFDCYALHWPASWAYTGPLGELADRPVEEQEARTFPTDEDGNRRTADTTLVETWTRMESLHDDGLARTLGVCNVDRATLADLLEATRVPPAVVQVESHPYLPRTDLVEYCHERGIRVVAHSPLSAPDLLDEPVLAEVAAAHDATPAQVVLAWNVGRGVVPIPSSVDAEHVVENAAAAGIRLTADERARVDALADPEFDR
ncbi:aldo/keto reductase [Halobium salinum]|uniref:Aldo/keto reductase n=1 Tax=Halobium salinum TaxID=1364940 RepID=A0ABD5PCY0_9EURY|nr:aldo/keto reductase [Halobium salinum]